MYNKLHNGTSKGLIRVKLERFRERLIYCLVQVIDEHFKRAYFHEENVRVECLTEWIGWDQFVKNHTSSMSRSDWIILLARSIFHSSFKNYRASAREFHPSTPSQHPLKEVFKLLLPFKRDTAVEIINSVSSLTSIKLDRPHNHVILHKNINIKPLSSFPSPPRHRISRHKRTRLFDITQFRIYDDQFHYKTELFIRTMLKIGLRTIFELEALIISLWNDIRTLGKLESKFNRQSSTHFTQTSYNWLT